LSDRKGGARSKKKNKAREEHGTGKKRWMKPPSQNLVWLSKSGAFLLQHRRFRGGCYYHALGESNDKPDS